MKYVCDVCGYVYDPEIGDPDNGVDAGTAWEDVPQIGYAVSAVQAKTNFPQKNY